MSIEEVISDSPYRSLTETFWMYESGDSGASHEATTTVWGLIDDGLESTKVVASEERPSDFRDNGYGPLHGFRLKVSKPFAAPGFLASACTAIANHDIAVLVISTFTYDYVFVRTDKACAAESALKSRGFIPETAA